MLSSIVVQVEKIKQELCVSACVALQSYGKARESYVIITEKQQASDMAAAAVGYKVKKGCKQIRSQTSICCTYVYTNQKLPFLSEKKRKSFGCSMLWTSLS